MRSTRAVWWSLALLVACDDGGGSGGEAGPTTDAAVDASAGPTCPQTVPEGFICAPAGTFQMGSPDTETVREEDEVLHTVTLTKPFLIKRTEVTQREWLAHIPNNPAWFRDGGEGQCRGEGCLDRPVDRVSFFDALAWCNAASEAEGLTPCYDLSNCGGDLGGGCETNEPQCLEGYTCGGAVTWRLDCDGYRLPTEAEWEYAARAGSTEAHYGVLDLIAWHRTTARGRSHGVGELDPNAWGLVDTLGNVGEWVWDIYDPNYGAFQPGRNPQTDPLGAEFGDTRTIRGCGWDTGNIFCRLAARETDFGAKHWNQLGFRPARSIQ